MNNHTPYEKPEVVTITSELLLSSLGHSLSCTGFGGATHDC